MTIHAKAALLPEGWARNVRVGLADGVITDIATDTPGQFGDWATDVLICGVPNLHSHAFQRGFSGLTEHRGPTADSFWTWREAMYRLALRLTPDEMQSLAALAYIEMLEAGYTRVGEFHYLHHAPDGAAYPNAAEMSARIFAAAAETGINLTHLPVFYAHGGFGPQTATDGQRRFLHDLPSFERLIEACSAMARPQDRVGLAPHSMRAASIDQIAHLAEAFPDRPFHIHIAEQLKEVSDCLAFSGKRPVDYLLAEAPVGPDWCLIHATHLTDAEVKGIADCGAVVGLCPITEANLGDGVFPAAKFLRAGGRVGIGTDSNVEITAAGEMKMLEYSQRLIERGRNICADAGSTGARLYQSVLAGGSQALGAPMPALALGAVADLVALKDSMAMNVAGDTILDRWIFGTDLAVSDVWVGGAHVVRDGRHVDRSQIIARAAQVCRNLI